MNQKTNQRDGEHHLNILREDGKDLDIKFVAKATPGKEERTNFDTKVRMNLHYYYRKDGMYMQVIFVRYNPKYKQRSKGLFNNNVMFVVKGSKA